MKEMKEMKDMKEMKETKKMISSDKTYPVIKVREDKIVKVVKGSDSL